MLPYDFIPENSKCARLKIDTIKVTDTDNFCDRTEYRRREWERGGASGWTPFSSHPSRTRHGHYPTRVNMNYIKAPSGPSALISASLYLAYDDEPARNSSTPPE